MTVIKALYLLPLIFLGLFFFYPLADILALSLAPGGQLSLYHRRVDQRGGRVFQLQRGIDRLAGGEPGHQPIYEPAGKALAVRQVGGWVGHGC